MEAPKEVRVTRETVNEGQRVSRGVSRDRKLFFLGKKIKIFLEARIHRFLLETFTYYGIGVQT